MSKTIVLASNNAGKVREISAMLADLPVSIVPQSQFNLPSVEETGLTFVENALIKARYAATHSGLAAIADDSGIEVDALKGQPGIYSARYAGVDTMLEASDMANNRKLLAALSAVPAAERTARFVCLMVYLRFPEDPTPLLAQGVWEGRITFEPHGQAGFGYDPVFFVPSHGCTSAQLDPTVKNSLSHRGQALRQLVAALHRLKM